MLVGSQQDMKALIKNKKVSMSLDVEQVQEQNKSHTNSDEMNHLVIEQSKNFKSCTLKVASVSRKHYVFTSDTIFAYTVYWIATG